MSKEENMKSIRWFIPLSLFILCIPISASAHEQSKESTATVGFYLSHSEQEKEKDKDGMGITIKKDAENSSEKKMFPKTGNKKSMFYPLLGICFLLMVGSIKKNKKRESRRSN